jgi:hypothetical protein
MSPAMAQEMQYTGDFYQGKNLIGKTNLNYILPKVEVQEKAESLALAIAEKPRRALTVLKRYQSMQRRKLFEETYSIETMMHELTFNEEEILKIIQDKSGATFNFNQRIIPSGKYSLKVNEEELGVVLVLLLQPHIQFRMMTTTMVNIILIETAQQQV